MFDIVLVHTLVLYMRSLSYMQMSKSQHAVKDKANILGRYIVN